MEEVTTLFDSDEAEYEYMKEQEARHLKAEEEKQIEEMARIICGNNRDCRDCEHNSAVRECGCLFYAKRIYEQDYRKQSEGKWIFAGDGIIQCTSCEEVYDARAWPRNYCPNCGAKMDGKEAHNG